ncbi:MAG: hypothetical protein M3268_08525, partial [Acidobacteriota bacterium]|nr:hypothetical protein [Acidobacteriota bacterium]
LYHYVDTGTYVAPLALLLALCAVVAALRARGRAEARVWFWLAVAAVSFLLLLGSNTPLNRLAYHVPVIRQFRVPSRHTFEWTLAVSVLAAYGWDAVAAWFARRRELVTIKGSARGGTTREKATGDRTTDERATGERATRARGLNLVVALALLAAGLFVGAMWWRATSRPPVPNPSIYTGLPESSYWLWKLAFTVVVFALACCSFRLRAARQRAAMLGATVMLACFFEPAATISCWWGRQLSLPAARVRAVSPTTSYLREFPPEQNRVYTRATLFSEEFNASPRLESPNLHAVYGLQNLAGMEPVVLERFSLALGGVGPDSVTPREGFPPNEYIFGARSRVLDLLNTTHVVTYAGLNTSEAPLTYKDGVGLSTADLRAHLAPGESARLAAAAGDADQLVLVTSLSNSGEEPQGSTVALARVFTADGGAIELPVRAGVDTAEWAHERADVRPSIRHALAPVFDGSPGDAADSFTAYRYWSRLPLGGPRRVARVEIENVSRRASLSLTYATLYDSRSGRSAPLSRGALSQYWTTVYDRDQVQILRNARARPRAWLVGEAEAVDGTEALRRVRGDEGAREFDPARTALLEVKQDELPKLPGGEAVAGGEARVVAYEPARLVVETDAPAASVLVVSEMFYPGWEATVDGRRAPILLADYLLRGVALPAGRPA